MNNIPRKARFHRAEEMADAFLVKMNITKLPFAPLDILRQMGVKISTYGKIANRLNCSYDEIAETFESADGYSSYDADTNKYAVAYNETKYPPERQRWTLAHELGHIVLGHFTEFTETRLARGGLTGEEYRVLDQEADAFASEVLAPGLVLFESGAYRERDIIQDVCDISFTAAKYKAQHLSRIAAYTNVPRYRLLRQQFFDFINSQYCPVCHALFVIKDADYCPICGGIHHTWYNPNLTIFEFLKDERGVIHHMIYPGPDFHNCPKCDNEEIAADDAYCKICGTTLVNVCTNEQCQADADNNARYCVHCGSPTTYLQQGILEPWTKIPHDKYANFFSDDIPF